VILFISGAKDGFSVRKYEEKDFKGVYSVYKEAFSEEPWNEYKKCTACGVNYGIKESENRPAFCKKCDNALKLEDYWTEEDVKSDIRYAGEKSWNSILVASYRGKIIGFTWGYTLQKEDFPFLGSFSWIIDCSQGIYVDEVATAPSARGRGVATALERRLFEEAEKSGFKSVVLRTDERNSAAMNLYKKLGFKPLEEKTGRVYDPKFSSRIYLAKVLYP
jgi:ribosomal protein S18 acetylase RimI-like enzyme